MSGTAAGEPAPAPVALVDGRLVELTPQLAAALVATPPAPAVPERVTNAQARAAMRALILPDGRSLERAVAEALAADKAAASALPDADPRRVAADMAWLGWEQANDYTRRGQLVGQMAARLGFDDAALDALFVAASAIEF